MTTRASAGARPRCSQHEPTDTGVARGEAVVVDEVLPDRDGIPTQARLDNELAVRLAGTRGRRALRWG